MPEPAETQSPTPAIPAAGWPLLVLLLVAPALLVFALTGSPWGILVGVLTAGGLTLFAARGSHPEPIELAPEAGARERILVVLLGSVPEASLSEWRDRVLERRAMEAPDAPAEALVLAPAAGSRLKRWLSLEDDARRKAADRVDGALPLLQGEGLRVRGQVGDGDPMLAIEDALRQFAASRVVLVGDVEAGVLAEELAPRLRQPVEVVDAAGAQDGSGSGGGAVGGAVGASGSDG